MERVQRILGPNVVDGKMDDLKLKFQHLESKKKDIEEELKNEVKSSTRKRSRKEVKNWIENVQCTKVKVEELEQEVLTSGFLKRLHIEEKVDRLTREVIYVTGQSKFERGLTLEMYDNQGVALLTKKLIGETFVNNKRKIVDCLMEGRKSIIGVLGMGGVGKTTLITHIFNELLDHRDVHVSWVTVSQNFNIYKLQHDIAKAIGFDISKEDDVRKRAAVLVDVLGKRKKLILILDDVWENISLIDVGICIGQNVWKLILTTRSLTVCRMLKCGSIIKVEPLSEVESWALFVETLDNDVLLSDDQIDGIAKSLVRECDGLPLGIAVMAGCMRGVDDIHEWSNALEEIREAKYSSGDMDFYDKVFLVLRYSYDKLKDPIVKKCLLYCSLFPEDMLIRRDELIEYFIDENMIYRMNNRQSALEKGHTILNKLENICLLEAQIDVNGNKCVKMHDLVRDMAIKIARDSPHPFLVQSRMGLTYLSDDEKWCEDISTVSLMYNNIVCIPSNLSPRCPRLSTLLLQHNKILEVIPNKFFMHMKLLSVLDLSFTGIRNLPTSIANLESLTALLLGSCERLKDLPSLENLTALRKLDLSRTTIEDAPKGIEKLSNLTYLNLHKCRNLKMIPDGILPQLSKMEWFCSSSSLRLRGEEIGSWRKIETFCGSFSNIDNLNKCARLWEERGPTKYDIVVGLSSDEDDEDFADVGFNKKVFVVGNEDDKDTFVLPPSIKTLRLECCNGLCSLSHIAPFKKITDLRTCYISECNMMRHLVCSCCGDALFFQSLEILDLSGLPMLTDLVERNNTTSFSSSISALQNNTFFSLKQLSIEGCHKLERLFTPAMLSGLQCLKVMEVWDCNELVEIVGERIREDEDRHVEATTTTILSIPPNLEYLILLKLPSLKSICNSSIRLSDSLQYIRITDCPELKRITLLWDEPHFPISLQNIKVRSVWWNSVEWKHAQTKDVLQPFVTFS